MVSVYRRFSQKTLLFRTIKSFRSMFSIVFSILNNHKSFFQNIPIHSKFLWMQHMFYCNFPNRSRTVKYFILFSEGFIKRSIISSKKRKLSISSSQYTLKTLFRIQE